jgi:16S rRNA (guanine966-N2)-methyltransferase
MVREAIFNICQHVIPESRFLDLFAGSGAMALEAISRGAASAACVESHPLALKAIRQNIEALGVKQVVTVYPGDVLRVLHKLKQTQQHFQMIYADPPYEDYAIYVKLLEEIDTSTLLSEGGHFFLEAAVQMPALAYQPSRLRLRSQRRYGKSQLLHYTMEEG